MAKVPEKDDHQGMLSGRGRIDAEPSSACCPETVRHVQASADYCIENCEHDLLTVLGSPAVLDVEVLAFHRLRASSP